MKYQVGVPVITTALVMAEFSELVQHVHSHHPWPEVSISVVSQDFWHTRIETAEGPWIDVSSAILASGGQYLPDVYRLHIKPHLPGDSSAQIQWIDLVGLPSYSFNNQQMYGRFGKLEELMAVLSDQLHLTDSQLSAIEQNLLAGAEVEIGGRVPGAVRVFDESSLRGIGMSHRAYET